MSHSISVIQGNITEATTDAIVNAANTRMLGGGGVDGAIHKAAGPELLAHCKRVPVVNGIRCPVGEARITPAGRISARWVIHTVGPRYNIDPDPQRLLASAYRNSLVLGRKYGCGSIAFPAISCGVFGYPHAEAAQISMAVCCENEWNHMNISFYLFSDQMAEIWRKALLQIG